MRRSKFTSSILLGIAILTFAFIALFVSRRWADRGESSSELTSGGLVSTTGPISKQSAADDSALNHAPMPNHPSDVSNATEHPLDPLLQLAREIKVHMERDVHDYAGTLIKRERIGGELGAETKMEFKIRNRNGTEAIPLSAYIRFVEPKSVKGREVIWVENKNGNKLVSHEAGFLNLKRISLAPDSMLAMAGNKYPITEVGLLRLVEKLIEKGERDRQLGLCEVEVLEDQRVGEQVCRLYQIKHPSQDEKFDFHIAQIFVDMERKIPLRYAAFLWPKGDEPPPLEEEYTYLDLEINIGLTDRDFDPDNPGYDYPSF